jgi:archaeosortase A (PGF-CTERM-specific)
MNVPPWLTEPLVLPVTDVLAWVVIGTFLAGAAADWADRRATARRLTAAAWWVFGLFWLLLIQHFAFVHKSVVETVGLLIAVPICVYLGRELLRGRESLLVLSRAVAFAGLLYLPFLMSTWARGLLIEVVARQSYAVIDALGYDGISLEAGPSESGGTLTNTFANDAEGVRNTYVVFACTGIESMATFGGLVAAVRAPIRRKVLGAAAAVGIIWVLNLGRNAFIAIANAYQWFAIPWIEGPVMTVFGLSDPTRVSFFFADRVLSQSLAVVALVGVIWLVSRFVPELLDLAEDVLTLLTGTEVTLRSTEGADVDEPRTAGDD